MENNRGRSALEYFVILAVVIGLLYFGLNAIGYKSIFQRRGHYSTISHDTNIVCMR